MNVNVKEIMAQLRNDPAYKLSVANNDVEAMQMVLRAHRLSTGSNLSYNYEFAQQMIISEQEGK